ncbi:vanadium-dependent haloperoxidase [Muricoccus radiodurans]|uniref:vanadium-dependent haloperoxidase n=1 Tax=Muricoccus radiodurans TaxID=2231721 RepID=UPI003CF1A454
MTLFRLARRGLLAAIAVLVAWPTMAQTQMAPGDRGRLDTAPPPGGLVTAWTLAADRLGGGASNWRTRAIMHIAMHDALNAAEPRYARWRPAGRGEPPPNGAAPLVAMAAAAYHVLLTRHPEAAVSEADRLFRDAVAADRPGAPVRAATRLGTAVARATLAAYPNPSGIPPLFPTAFGVGQWRPTPEAQLNSTLNPYRPFLPVNPAELAGRPPNQLDSPRYLADLEEVRMIGALRSTLRTPAQTAAAFFWAEQSSQRGFAHLAVRLLAEHPLPGGVWEEARAMAVLSVSLADSAIIAWDAKRRYGFWRPVTALNTGTPGAPSEPGWRPLIETPPHPDHPSGHATDCSAGAHALRAVFGRDLGPVAYPGVDVPGDPVRTFNHLSQVAVECASSRLWAGVHFRTANEEGLRLGEEIARRAIAAVPALPRAARVAEATLRR